MPEKWLIYEKIFMSQVIQKPRKRRGATGKISSLCLFHIWESSQKSVPRVYPIPIIHQKWSGPAVRPISMPSLTSPPPTHVGRSSMSATEVMSLSAVFSQTSILIQSQKGKNRGVKRILKAS